MWTESGSLQTAGTRRDKIRVKKRREWTDGGQQMRGTEQTGQDGDGGERVWTVHEMKRRRKERKGQK